MSGQPRARREFRFAWRTKRQVTNDVDAELAFHLARRIEELTESGLSLEDARHERETKHTTMIDELKQDLVYALRNLRSAPGFALVALLTLALGIGANTAIFSVVRGVLLSPLPFPDADRVIRVWHANPSESDLQSRVGEPDYLEWLAASKRFASLGAYWYAPGGSGADLTGSGTPERIQGAYVTPGFFETLRPRAALGRTIRPE